MNTDYKGFDLGWIQNVATAKDCQTLCLNNKACKFWTFGTHENSDYPGWCFLKTSSVLSESSGNFISGAKICGKLSRLSTICILWLESFSSFLPLNFLSSSFFPLF